MPNRIKDLIFRCDMNWGGGNSRLFLGVLGIEYRLDHNYVSTTPTSLLGLTGSKPNPDRLLYDYINRTANREEWAYSDGVLPVYLRFQPDLVLPLDTAAGGVPSGAMYDSYFVELYEPEVTIVGTESNVANDGSVTYKDEPVTFVVPVNPPNIRRVRLSPSDGLMLFLARIR